MPEIQLIEVTCTKIAGVPSCHHNKSTRSHQIRNQDIYVFVEIKLDEKVFHGYLAKGSINSSGMLLRSI